MALSRAIETYGVDILLTFPSYNGRFSYLRFVQPGAVTKSGSSTSKSTMTGTGDGTILTGNRSSIWERVGESTGG